MFCIMFLQTMSVKLRFYCATLTKIFQQIAIIVRIVSLKTQIQTIMLCFITIYYCFSNKNL